MLLCLTYDVSIGFCYNNNNNNNNNLYSYSKYTYLVT